MKKGFTLIELLAVIVILAIIALIAIPRLTKTIEESKINAHRQNNASVIRAAQNYIVNNDNMLPKEVGDTKEVNIESLINNKLMTSIKNPYGSNNCLGYVLITKLENGFTYEPHLNCATNINNSIDDGLVLSINFNNNSFDNSVFNHNVSIGSNSYIYDRFNNKYNALLLESDNRTFSVSSTSNLELESFTLSKWVYYNSYDYPRTLGAVKKSSPHCYVSGGRGFDFGHGTRASGIDICVADGVNNIRTGLNFNEGNRPSDLLGEWFHLTLVINRDQNTVYSYINGNRQDHFVDISSITGNIANDSTLIFGSLYGWWSDGFIDDVLLYNRVLSDDEVLMLYRNRL